ncbi:MAG: ATP-grasp domain-containing protein [Actinobacteria bacterium]|nr:ATP-grasp domain-containing protein [Actinomycetota bacterium]
MSSRDVDTLPAEEKLDFSEMVDSAGPTPATSHNLFVVGFSEFHRPLLEAVTEAQGCTFHPLLEEEELLNPRHVPVRELLDQGHRQLDAFDGSVDGICTYWDFPSSCIAPILAADRGLPHVPLDAILRCEHKYWSRLEQQKIVPEQVPGFNAVNPFDESPGEQINFDYPFWLKPVKSFNAYLGFYIGGPEDLEHAIGRIRAGIHHLANAFNDVLERVEMPPEMEGIDGWHCIAEEIIPGGRQCTVEGYGHEGDIYVYGIVDSRKYPGKHAFSHYEYPSMLPERVQERITETTAKVMGHIGYYGGAFNIEFFWDEKTDRLWLLEINTRVSQSHSELFASVDGQANHAVTVGLALGKKPRFESRQGKFPCAAKFFLRAFSDGVVEHVADPERIEQIPLEVPGTRVELQVKPGDRLSEMPHQESYSYELAWIYAAGESESEILEKIDAVVDRLDIRIDEGVTQ